MTTTIKVTRARVTGRPGRAWHWHYYAQGPDTIQVGDRVLPRRFDNSSYAELRRVLRRRYGTVVLVPDWNTV